MIKTFGLATVLTVLCAMPALAAPSVTTAVTPSWNIPLDGRPLTNGVSVVAAVGVPLDATWRMNLEGGVYVSLNKLGDWRPRLSVSARQALNKDWGLSYTLGANTNLGLTSQTYSLLLSPSYKLNNSKVTLSCALGPTLSMSGSKYVGVGLAVAPRLTLSF